MAVNPLDPIQAVQQDFDRLTLALGNFRASLTDATARATASVLPPGFIDVTQLRETLEIIDLEVRRAEERLKNAMRESALLLSSPGEIIGEPIGGPMAWLRPWGRR
ncbi:hypothetical protein ES703_17720 [subsurface metagenome]